MPNIPSQIACINLLRRAPFCRNKAPMQISKRLLAICVTLVCLIPLSSHGADKAGSSALNPSPPEAIDKAREVMRQKMDELAGQTPRAKPEAPAPPTAPVQQTSPPPPPPAVAPAVPAAPPPTTAAAPATSDATGQARAAVRQKFEETTPTPPQAPAVPSASVPPAGRLPMEPPPAPPVITGPQADEASIAKAREATREKIAEMERHQHITKANEGNTINTTAGGPTRPPAPTKPPKPPKPAMPTTPPSSVQPPVAAPSGFPPLHGPPSPLSPEKQQRLAELLRRYKADQLTPEQYQTERAKIRAEP